MGINIRCILVDGGLAINIMSKPSNDTRFQPRRIIGTWNELLIVDNLQLNNVISLLCDGR